MSLGFDKAWILSLQVIAISLLFALSFGLKMGDNQNTYFLYALHKLNPQLWSRDWLVTSTHHYHLFFSYLAILLGHLGNLFWVAAILNFAIIASFALLLYNLLLKLEIDKPFLVFVLSILFLTIEGTDSIGQSYLFSSVLQPSSIASFFFILGIFSYIKKEDLTAGLFFGIAGIFHENFLVLVFPMLFLSDLICERRNPSLIIKHIGPSLIVLICMLPLLLKASFSEHSDTARHIFQIIRAPNHYYPQTFLFDYVLFLGWQVFAIAGLNRFLATSDVMRKRLVALYASTAILPLIATFLTTFVFIPQVAQVYFFRLAPYSILLARIIGLVSLLGLMFDTGRPHILRRDRIMNCACYILSFFLLSIYYFQNSDYFPKKAILLLLCLILLLTSWIYFGQTKQAKSHLYQNALRYFLTLLLVISFLGRMTNYHSKFNLIFGPEYSDAQMYKWVESSKPDNLFMISPGLLDDFRITSKRSIVVDWRSTPILPDELVQWYERIVDVSGGFDIQNEYECLQRYHSLRLVDIETIRNKYHPDYAVFLRNELKQDYNYPIVFQNDKFLIYQLQQL
jgi:hypothetical protein